MSRCRTHVPCYSFSLSKPSGEALFLNRYSPTHFSQVNRQLIGVYYVASQHSECSPRYMLDGKLSALAKRSERTMPAGGQTLTTTGAAAALALPDRTVDYIFTDPPFGENIFYADLNFAC